MAAAVAIQQALGRHGRSEANDLPPLEVRIGLSAGDVILEEGDCFGTPVAEAARLCAAARGGQVLVTDVVRRLAGSTAGHAFTALGPVELKGLPDPVPTCEVVWEPLPESLVPLPALLTDVHRVFVGREAQLERLGQIWKETAAGELRVALVSGEPGVGKTRLAAEIAGKAHGTGATVLGGRCDEGMSVPYQPFVEAMRHFVDHTPDEALTARLGRFGGEIVRLLPELAERAPGLPPPLQSDPETERYRLFDAVTAWLAAASAEEPVLLVLDDLQWAAKPTLLLLRHRASSPEPIRLLIVGIYRDSDLGHDHPLVEVLADLRRQEGVERLSLKGLDSSGVAEFMERAGGHTLTDEELILARAIHEETDGNPWRRLRPPTPAGRRCTPPGPVTAPSPSSPTTKRPATTGRHWSSSSSPKNRSRRRGGSTSSPPSARPSITAVTPVTGRPSGKRPSGPSGWGTPSGWPGRRWPATGDSGTGASASTPSGWPSWRRRCGPGATGRTSCGPASSPFWPPSRCSAPTAAAGGN